MKWKAVLAGALLVAASTQAFAQGPYVGLAGGLSITHDSDIDVSGVGSGTISYDTGYGVGLAAGYDFDGARLEAEYGFKAADLDTISGAGGSVSMTDSTITLRSYMVNGYLDIKTNSPVTPFVGAGLGIVKEEVELAGDSRDDTLVGYQATAGASLAASKNLKFDLSYRLMGTSSDFEREGVKISYMSSNILFGMRYNF